MFATRAHLRVFALLSCLLSLFPFTGAFANPALDLSSTTPGVVVTQNMLHGATPTINVGGKPLVVHVGQAITSAEFVAMQGVLSSGQQTLVLGTQGQAVGGMFLLTGSNSSLDSLVVPHGVAAIAPLAALKVAGSLTDGGSLIGLGTSNFHSFTVTANDINVLTSGLLSTRVPTAFSNFDPGHAVALNINSANITNAGTISSSGNINFRTGANTNLTIDNTGGVISANNIINFRSALYNSTAATTVLGGLLSAQAINFNAGRGNLLVDADEIDGVVNVVACTSHIATHTGTLTMGLQNVSGDPTIVNTGGNVILTNDQIIHDGGSLAILASGDIDVGTATVNGKTTTCSLIDLSTTGTTAPGNLSIVSGAHFSVGSTVGQQTDTQNNYTIDGGSPAGGDINLSTVNIKTSYSGTTQTHGGNVLAVAFGGSNVFGDVNLGNINTSSSNGTGGSVSAFATDVIVGTIDTHGKGTTGFGGNVDLESMLPVINGTPTFNNGTLSGGSFTTGGLASSGAGGVVFVSGKLGVPAIVTTGTAGSGGVFLRADNLMEILGGINASGATNGIAHDAAGDPFTVNTYLQSDNDRIQVTGDINVKATGSSASSPGVKILALGTGLAASVEILGNIFTNAPLNAGSVFIQAHNILNVGYNQQTLLPLPVSTNGGIFTAGGRNGGNVTLQTAGPMLIGKGIDAHGTLTPGSISVPSCGTFLSNGPIIDGGTDPLGGTDGSVSITTTGANQFKGLQINGSITTGSKTGPGFNNGAITLSAPNEEVIVSGAINSSSASGAGGAITVQSGFDANVSKDVISSGGSANGGNVSITSTNGAVTIGGTVKTDSTVGAASTHGGTVTVTALDGVSVGNGVSARGLSGNTIDLESVGGIVNVKGNVNSSGLTLAGVAAGGGGNITLGNGAGGVQVSGNIISDGGSSTGTSGQTGGQSGNITIAGAHILTNITSGYLQVGGYISAKGGSTGGTSVANGTGGAITLDETTVQVGGTAPGGGSINVAAGTGGNGSGGPGSVTIDTYGVQPLSTDLNLASKTQDQFVMPGAQFDFGSASANGVKSGIVADGASTILSTHAPFGLPAGTTTPGTASLPSGVITINIKGVNQTNVDFNDAAPGVFSTTHLVSGKSVRMMATPAEALALYDVSRQQTQTIGLLSLLGGVADKFEDGQSSGINDQTVQGYDIARPFTAFNIATGVTTSPFAIILTVDQQASNNDSTVRMLLPASSSVPGVLIFHSLDVSPKTARIDFGSGKLTIGLAGGIGDASSGVGIDLRGANLSLLGAGTIPSAVGAQISSSQGIVVRNEAAALTVSMAQGSAFNTPGSAKIIFDASNGGLLNNNLTIKVPSNVTELASFNGGQVELLGKNISVGTASSSRVGFGPQLNTNSTYNVIDASGTATIGGSTDLVFTGTEQSGGTLTAAAQNNFTGTGTIRSNSNVGLFTTSHTGVGDFSNDSIRSQKALTVHVGNLHDITSSTFFFSITSLSVTGDAGVDFTAGFTSLVSHGNVSLLCPNGNINFFGDATAGLADTSFNPAAGVPKLSLFDKGSVTIEGQGTITISNTSTIQSDGGNVLVIAGFKNPTALSGNLNLGAGNNYAAEGGNLSLLANGNISDGGTGNTYTAVALAGSSAGGGIEIQAGKTTPSLPGAIAKRTAPPVTLPTGVVALSSDPNVANAIVQVIGDPTFSDSLSKGTFNFTGATLLNTSANQSIINTRKGVVLVNANNGATVTLNQATFNTFIPIAQQSAGTSEDVVVDSDDDAAECDTRARL